MNTALSTRILDGSTPAESDLGMPRPGVLLVGTHLSSSRFNHSVSEDLAMHLTGAGWKVTMTSSKTGRIARVGDMLHTAWRRRRDYAVAQVDVYSGPAFGWAEAVCWSLRRARKPYVLTLHGGNLPQFARKWPARVRRLLESAAVVTAPSPYLFEQMKPYRDNMVLLPNPLDVDHFQFTPRGHVRPRLVWLRAFQDLYNPMLAIRTLAVLRSDYPDAHLTMVGPDKDGSLEPTRALAVRLGVDGQVDWPGGVPHDHVPSWLNEGDIFLNTSDVDNTPVSVLEALACGLCVVTTSSGGLPYLLDHGKDALLVPPGDPIAMAGAVRRVLADPGLAASLSRNGRQKAERCAWGTALPKWTNILMNAASLTN